jgi:hypothetical protein
MSVSLFDKSDLAELFSNDSPQDTSADNENTLSLFGF